MLVTSLVYIFGEAETPELSRTVCKLAYCHTFPLACFDMSSENSFHTGIMSINGALLNKGCVVLRGIWPCSIVVICVFITFGALNAINTFGNMQQFAFKKCSIPVVGECSEPVVGECSVHTVGECSVPAVGGGSVRAVGECSVPALGECSGLVFTNEATCT